jgi:hypothetical protein
MDDSETHRLVEALVAAFPEYLGRRLAELGVVADAAIDAAVEAAAVQLRAGLAELLSRPAGEQEDSPLEVMRRATSAVSEALAATGVAAPDRDAWEVEVHPEDRYGLYPASSQVLGETAWRLHLEWGVRKAGAVAGVVPAPERAVPLPTVALFGVPIDQRGPLQEAIEDRDFQVLVWRNPAALADAEHTRPVLALVHLTHPEAHRAVRELAKTGIRVVAVGDRVDDLITPGIMALGAAAVVESRRVIARLDRLLPDRA